MARPLIKITIFRGEFSNRIREWERRVLLRSGGFTRSVMRRRIRRKAYGSTSPPGGFPYAHAPGGAGLKAIYFDVKLGFVNSDVVIGPQKFVRKRPKMGKQRRTTIRSRKVVPQLINEGGPASVITEWKHSGITERGTANYPARPFRDIIQPIAENFLREAMRTTSEGFR